MRIYLKLLLTGMFLLTIFSCTREEAQPPYQYDREVIAIFPPEGIIAHTSSELIYRSLFKVTDDLQMLFRPIFPDTYEEGLRTISDISGYDRIGSNRLIMLADPMYAEDLVRQGMSKNVVDTDSTKVLVLGTYTDQPNLYNAYIPMYGVMYKAGYIAGKMNDVNSASILLPTNKYAFYKESSQGFIDGYRRAGEKALKVDNFGNFTEDARFGLSISEEVYSLLGPDYEANQDIAMAICGDAINGLLRYNRENPGAFYTIGLDTDMSAYADDVPYSCLIHWDKVLYDVVSKWNRDKLQRSEVYSLGMGTSIAASAKHRNIIQPLSEEINEEAIKKENEYTY